MNWQDDLTFFDRYILTSVHRSTFHSRFEFTLLFLFAALHVQMHVKRSVRISNHFIELCRQIELYVIDKDLVPVFSVEINWWRP